MRPVLEDDRRWEREALDLQHTGLASIRETAALWEKSITGLLGAFGLVAFLKGPEALSDVPSAADVAWSVPFVANVDPARTVIALILAAGFLAGVAIFLAARAGQDVPDWVGLADGVELRRRTRERARSAINDLRLSRGAAVLAALVLLVAVAVAWVAQIEAGEHQKAPSVNALVATEEQTRCGVLTTGENGEATLSLGDAAPVALTGVTDLTIVESCP